MSADNLVTSANIIGSGMRQETSETDSTIIGNDYESSSTTALNTLYEHLPMFCVDNNTPFHSARLCLIQSHIL